MNALLEHPNIDVNLPDETGATPLWYAIAQKHTDVALRLLRHPGVDITREHIDTEETCIYKACNNGLVEVVQALLEHPNISTIINKSAAENGNAPIHACIRLQKDDPQILRQKKTECLIALISHPGKRYFYFICYF